MKLGDEMYGTSNIINSIEYSNGIWPFYIILIKRGRIIDASFRDITVSTGGPSRCLHRPVYAHSVDNALITV